MGLRLSSLSQTVGNPTPVAFTYDAVHGYPIRTKGTTTATYAYDARGRVINLAHRFPDHSDWEANDDDDGADGNLEHYRERNRNRSVRHTYCAHGRADRLLGEARSGGSAGNNSYAYQYDARSLRKLRVRLQTLRVERF